jgi:hypothetical protein
LLPFLKHFEHGIYLEEMINPFGKAGKRMNAEKTEV